MYDRFLFRIGRRWFPLLGIVLLFSGCGRETVVSAVEVTESVRGRALLVSEILAADDRARLLDCPIRIENLGESTQQLQVVGTGCACYGLTLDGRLIKREESIPIPPGSVLTLGIQGMPPDVQSEKDYEANLEFTVVEGESHPVSVRCRLNVYQDVRLTPNVVTCETEFGEARHDRRPVTVQRVFRSETGLSPEPIVRGLPENVSLEGLQREGAPEELETGLWRITWTGMLNAMIPDDTSPTAPLSTFQVLFEEGAQLLASGTGQLSIRSRASIAFPREIHFGRLKVGQLRQRRVMLASTDAEPFTLTVDEEQSSPELHAVVRPEASVRQFVDLQVTPSHPGAFEETVTFRSDRRAQPTISIAIRGVVDPLED